MAKSRREPETAADLIARLNQDPAYRERRARLDAELAERTREWRIAEQPVIEDLKAIGIEVDTVWGLYKVPASRPKAIPVLLKHLVLDYPDNVIQGIGAGLSDRTARPWWNDMREIMLATERAAVQDRMAGVLSEIAIREHYDDLLDFVRNEPRLFPASDQSHRQPDPARHGASRDRATR